MQHLVECVPSGDSLGDPEVEKWYGEVKKICITEYKHVNVRFSTP